MSEPFLAEVRIVAFNFAPRGWAFCDGQILPISQNQSLYSLLGTTYGGDGRTSFALPDMRGRTPIHVGNGHREGQKGGEESVMLSAAQMPQHTHTLNGDDAVVNAQAPAGNRPGNITNLAYHEATNLVDMNSGVVANAGGGQAHNTMQPYLALNFCIALQGLFPSRN